MIKRNLLKIVILPEIVASLFLAGAMALAAPWQGPTAIPPSANTDAPVNTGADTQYKAGGFGIGGLFETDADVHLGVLSGKVGIGTTTPSEILEILGNIKIESQGQIKNMRVENVAALPPSGLAGQMVFNTSNEKMYLSDGSSWQLLPSQ